MPEQNLLCLRSLGNVQKAFRIRGESTPHLQTVLDRILRLRIHGEAEIIAFLGPINPGNAYRKLHPNEIDVRSVF